MNTSRENRLLEPPVMKYWSCQHGEVTDGIPCPTCFAVWDSPRRISDQGIWSREWEVALGGVVPS